MLLAKAAHTQQNTFHSGGKQLSRPIAKEAWPWGRVKTGGPFTDQHTVGGLADQRRRGVKQMRELRAENEQAEASRASGALCFLAAAGSRGRSQEAG